VCDHPASAPTTTRRRQRTEDTVSAIEQATGLVVGTLRWGGALAAELLVLPATLRQLREAVEVIGDLPSHVGRLADGLEDAGGLLDEHVPAVAETVQGFSGELERLVRTLDGALPLLSQLPGQLDRFEATVDTLAEQVGHLTTQLGDALPGLLQVVVEDLPARIENLDRVVSELSETVNNVLAAIPGVRRTLRSSG
jgi:ABC-type transporter Mla subunit MlaD